MALEKERYSSELTSKSKLELQKFSKWFHDSQGRNWPSVIGGWAVWSYHNDGFGSRDVDLVFPTDNFIENMMKNTYFPLSGFQAYKLDPILGEPHYGKQINSNDYVFFDLTSAETPREDSVNMRVEVDWNWIYDFEHPESIGNNASINVPDLEFLITLKIIGCISRSRELRHAPDPFYLSSKIWKDCYDVANLTNHLDPINKKLHQHFIRTKLDKKLVQEFLQICDGRKNALEEGNSKIGPIEELLDVFKK